MDFPRRFTSISLVFIAILTGVRINAQDTKQIHGQPMPKNIILLIGDGMGISHIQAGLTANFGKLNLLQFTSIGFSMTQPANEYVTDSGAGATALATGHKTYNGAIGVCRDSVPVKSILEYAEKNGLATGLVSTSAITHATPASFIAHNVSRDDYEAIAADFLKTDIDVFIGGGRDNFAKRKDHKNLLNDLKEKNYQVIFSIDSIKMVQKGKLAGLTAPMHNPGIAEGRGNMLPVATKTALNILSENNKGFFLMIEGSQIDWGAHGNNTGFVAMEMIDFDETIGTALQFARENGNTLVIVTADHETGGMAITNGSFNAGEVSAIFATTNHTGLMVPVFAFGPGAELFQRIQENTDIFKNMMTLFGFTEEACDETMPNR